MAAPHLLLDLSAHGLGHLAQAAPVVNALRRRLPSLRLTVRGGLPRASVSIRLDGRFRWLQESEADVGLCMASAVDVLPEASAEAYRRFHRDWSGRIRAEAARLRALEPTLVLSAVPYLSLAAASRLGIPALGLSSLNWAELFRCYCGDLPGVDAIYGEIRDAYRTADGFLRVTPALPMPGLERVHDVGPVAAMGRSCRALIQARLHVAPTQRLALVALGGIETRLPVETWPRLPGMCWLVPGGWESARDDFRPVPAHGLRYVDLVASCDVVITKPGYGTFVEAACHGVPVVYVERDDWPETPHLTRWLHAHANAVAVERERFWRGELADALAAVLAQPPRPPVVPSGVEEAAELLCGYLAR
jgi:hypothetical protein